LQSEEVRILQHLLSGPKVLSLGVRSTTSKGADLGGGGEDAVIGVKGNREQKDSSAYEEFGTRKKRQRGFALHLYLLGGLKLSLGGRYRF